jgi:hypothetical protein
VFGFISGNLIRFFSRFPEGNNGIGDLFRGDAFGDTSTATKRTDPGETVATLGFFRATVTTDKDSVSAPEVIFGN